MSNTIKLKKYADIINEEEAAGAITPGALVELTSADEIQNHSTAGDYALGALALEDELQGNTIEDDFADGDKVQVWAIQPGEEALALLKTGDTPSIGDHLYSDGAGALTTTAAGNNVPLAVCIGSVETDGQSNERVPVRWL